MTPHERFALIFESLPEELQKKLVSQSAYWSPETLLSNINSFVNSNVVKNANDPVSVRVYAAVCGLSERDVKIKMILDGFF